jgi:hypothetical protein
MTGRYRRWLRLGPSRAELRTEADRWRQRCEWADEGKRRAYARAKEAEKLVRQIRHQLHDQLNEPERVDGCSKVRFHREDEADGWAAAIAQATGEDPAAYMTYDCKRCPRSPVTMRKYWHVGHDDSGEAQREKAAGRARRADQVIAARKAGRTVAQQVDPQTAARLRDLMRRGQP